MKEVYAAVGHMQVETSRQSGTDRGGKRQSEQKREALNFTLCSSELYDYL